MIGQELAGCWLKIGRAEEHAKTISDEIDAWQKAKPYSFVLHKDAQGHRHSVTVHFQMPYRDRWELIAGDCIHNLRSALDHLVYGIAIYQTGINPPVDGRRLQFPIVDDPMNFPSQGTRIQCLSQTVRTAIERVQPYNRGHGKLPPLLSLIRDFDDRDKHRLLNITVSRQQQGDWRVDLPLGYVPIHSTINTNDLVDGAEIMSFTIIPPYPNVQYQYDTSFTIGFPHAPGPGGILVTGVRIFLSMLCEEVRTIVEMIGSKA